MKVLFLTNIPSPYMINFFNLLGKNCELTVIFEKSFSNERDQSWRRYAFENFKGVILRGISVAADAAISISVIGHLKKEVYDIIVVTNPCTPTGIIAIKYLKLKKIPYIIESEGGFAKNGKGIKEAIKKNVLSNAYLYLSTNSIGDNYFITYGANKNRLFKYPFTSIYEKDILPFPLNKNQKEELKHKHAMKENKVVLSVGQPIHRKGFDVLLNACKDISSKDVGIYIIGGKAPEELAQLCIDLDLNNIHFLEFIDKEELKEIYSSADIFVLPTREDVWGLVINEAMAAGLPIITTNKCIAAVDLVRDGENGYIVPVEDYIILSDKLNLLLADDDLAEKMSINSIERIREFTFEKMVERHIEIFKKIVRQEI